MKMLFIVLLLTGCAGIEPLPSLDQADPNDDVLTVKYTDHGATKAVTRDGKVWFVKENKNGSGDVLH